MNKLSIFFFHKMKNLLLITSEGSIKWKKNAPVVKRINKFLLILNRSCNFNNRNETHN